MHNSAVKIRSGNLAVASLALYHMTTSAPAVTTGARNVMAVVRPLQAGMERGLLALCHFHLSGCFTTETEAHNCTQEVYEIG